MQSMKRFLEWYLDIPPAGPGQGTAWNLAVRPPWPDWLPLWCVLLLAVFGVAYVAWIYHRDAKTLSRPMRGLLVTLRLSTIAVVLLFLAELTLTVDRTGLPVIVVMVDDSASMSLEDRYPDKKLAAQISALLKEVRLKEPQRINLAKAVLTRNNGRLLRQLADQHKLRVYRFSDTAHVMGRGEYLTDDGIDEITELLTRLEAAGDQTRPGPAVRKVLDDLRGNPPSAIVLLTDGITSTNDADKLTGIIELARSSLVPIFAVGVGSEEPSRDLQLYDTLVDEVAFVGDPVIFSANIKAYEYEGQKVTIRLIDERTGVTLGTKEVSVGADGQVVRVELSYTPPAKGEFDYILQADPLPNESNVTDNAETRHVSVRDDRIRVLLADSAPRYEFRYLKQLLERDKTVELHTVLQEADIEYAQEDATALDHFPVKREEMLDYDVVILGDLNPSFLSYGVYDNLNEFVRNAGGGLVIIAGQSYMPLAYRGTPLEALLPIKLDSAQAPPADIPIVEGFRPELTLAGRKSTTIFRFAESESDSMEVWKEFPELYWLFEVRELAEGAQVFAQHPTRSGASGRLPVIVKHRVGAGTVLFHATDELWRWRFRVGDYYYGRYWVQALRYLSRSKLIGRDRTADLFSDKKYYKRGDTVNLRVKFFDERLAPDEDDGVIVMLERRGDVQRAIKLTRLPQTPALFEGQFVRAPEGSYHAWIVAPAFDEAPPSYNFSVEAPLQEFQRRSLDKAELMQTADKTHGKFYTPVDAHKLADDIPPGRAVPLESLDPISLWSLWQTLIPGLTLFTALLATEWILRKRFRLI
jgi:uncharacterized membrane protein